MAVRRDPLETTISLAPGRVTVGVAGELDLYTARDLRDAVRGTITPDLSLVVDVSEVTFIDSVGLSALVSLAKSVRDSNGEFRLRNPSVRVKRMLDITGLDCEIPTSSDFQ